MCAKHFIKRLMKVGRYFNSEEVKMLELSRLMKEVHVLLSLKEVMSLVLKSFMVGFTLSLIGSFLFLRK